MSREHYSDNHVISAISPGFSRSRTVTARLESIVTASTCAVAAPRTRRRTASAASTLFLTATWYFLDPARSVTSTIQPKACSLMLVSLRPPREELKQPPPLTGRARLRRSRHYLSLNASVSPPSPSRRLRWLH